MNTSREISPIRATKRGGGAATTAVGNGILSSTNRTPPYFFDPAANPIRSKSNGESQQYQQSRAISPPNPALVDGGRDSRQNLSFASPRGGDSPSVVSAVLHKYGYRQPISTNTAGRKDGGDLQQPQTFRSIREPMMMTTTNDYSSRNHQQQNLNDSSYRVGVGGGHAVSTPSSVASAVATATAALQSRNEALEAKLTAAQNQREDSDRERNALNKKLLELTARLDATATSAAGTSALLESLERQQAAFDEDRLRTAEQHKKTLATVEAAREQLALKVQHLEQELEKSRRDAGAKEDEVITAKKSVNDLLTQTDRNKLNWEAKLQVLNGQMSAKESEIAALQQQVERERSLREDETLEGGRLRDTVESLTKRLQQFEASVGEKSVTMADALRHQQEEAESRLADLKHQLQIESQRRNCEEQEKESFMKQLEEAREETRAARTALLEEKKKLQEARNAAADGQQFAVQCEAKGLEIKRLSETYDRTRESLYEERRLKEAAEARLAILVSERDQLAKAEACLRDQINNSLQPQIRKLQAEISRKAEDISSLRLDGQEVTELKAQMDQILRGKERMSEELRVEKDRMAAATVELERSKREVIEAQRAIETLRMSERNLIADLKLAGDRQKTITGLEDEVHEKEMALEASTRSRAAAEKQIKLLEASVAAKDSEIDGFVKQLTASSATSAQVEALQAQLESERINTKKIIAAFEEAKSDAQRLAAELNELAGITREAQLGRDAATAERNNYEALYKEERDKHFVASEKLEEALSRVATAQLEIGHREEIANEIPFLRQEVEVLTATKRELREASKKLHDQIAEVNSNNMRLQLDNEELARKTTKYQLNAEALERQLNVLQEEMTAISSAHGALQVRHDESERQRNSLRHQIEALTVKVSALEADLAEMTDYRNALTLAGDELRAKLSESEAQLVRAERRVESAEGRIRQMEEMSEIASRRIHTLEADNRVLADTHASVSTLEGTIEGLRKAIAERDEERNTLETELARLRDADTKKHAAESHCSALQTQVDELRRVLQKREGALHEQDSEMASQSATLSRLQSALTTEQRSLAITKDSLAAAESQIDDLLRRLQESEERAKLRGAMEGRLEGTQRVLEAATKDLTEAKQTIASLEDANKVFQKEHDVTIPQLRREVKELRVHSKARQELFDSVQRELDDRISQHRQLQKEHDAQRAEMHSLARQCAELEVQLRDAQHKLDRSLAEGEHNSSRAEEHHHRSREATRALKGELNGLRDELSGAEETIKALQRDLSRATADSDRYKAELGKSEHTVGKLSVETTVLRASMDDKTYEHEYTLQQLNEAKENYSRLQQEAADLRTRLDASEAKILALSREKLDELKAKDVSREAYEKHIENLRYDNNVLAQQLENAEKGRGEFERKLFAVSAEKSSLYAQLLTAEAASAAHKESIKRELEEKQRLIVNKGELERAVLTLEAKVGRLESQLRVSALAVSSASEAALRHEAAEKSLLSDANRREQEHKVHMEVAQLRLHEREEAITKLIEEKAKVASISADRASTAATADTTTTTPRKQFTSSSSATATTNTAVGSSVTRLRAPTTPTSRTVTFAPVTYDANATTDKKAAAPAPSASGYASSFSASTRQAPAAVEDGVKSSSAPLSALHLNDSRRHHNNPTTYFESRTAVASASSGTPKPSYNGGGGGAANSSSTNYVSGGGGGGTTPLSLLDSSGISHISHSRTDSPSSSPPPLPAPRASIYSTSSLAYPSSRLDGINTSVIRSPRRAYQ